jgi:DNA polymerase bacteriophage-type
MKLTIDFETRSACDIKKHGAWVYSEHPTTEVLCLSLKWEGQQPFLRIPENGTDVGLSLHHADVIEAHNASFEYAIWLNVCMKKYGWPALPVEKLRCSAAKAAMHSLPRSLDGACRALGLPIQKDMEGYRLMLRMCRPRNARKGEPEINPKDPHGLYWNEDPADLERLYKYCMQDVIAEEALSNALADLPPKEVEIYQLDQVINARGIQADIEGAKAMLKMVGEHEEKLLAQLRKLTHGAVKTAKQVEAMRGYLRGLGVDLPDLAAATVKSALKKELPDDARSILNIRGSLGRSSSAKYQAIIDRSSNDGRVRGALLYHGAGTGRWAGSGIQPQNFPSRIKVSGDPEDMLGVICAGGLELHNALYDDDPMSTAGAVTRSVLSAKEGCDLIVADYSAIEGRGLAWLAGEEDELDNYRADLDPYITSAASILRKGYGAVTKDERSNPGKVSVLACGYGGSAGAVRKFGGHELIEKRLKETGLKGDALDEAVDEEITKTIVSPWRKAHPMTVQFWYGLESACIDAVRDPSKPTSYRGVSFRVQKGFLMCRLPSGRILYYYHPMIQPCVTSWGETKDAVTYMTVNGMTKHWERTNTYGGKLAENVTQAICRDLMAEAMLRVEAAGYRIVLTVHDELVAEVPEGFGSVEEFEKIMCVAPVWAKGFPIKAAGWRGKRYKK